MRAFFAVIALACTVLLGAIALELRTLNRSLNAAPSAAPAAAGLVRSSGAAPASETREQRRERYRRELEAARDDIADRLEAANAINARDSAARSQPSPKR